MMQPAEQNYEIYNKELLAIVEALTKWRQYLLDAKEPFEVWTDHENLKYFREPYKLNGRQAQWYLKLQDYDFTLKHIPGKTNIEVDILLRKDQVNTKEDNKDVQLLMIVEITMIQRRMMIEESNILKEIKRNTTRETEVVQALKEEDSLIWKEDAVVYMEGRVYVPNNRKIKEEILKENHNLADMKYLGQHRMLELIKRTYWWPGLKEDIKKYI